MALQNVSREGKWTSSVSTLNDNFSSLGQSVKDLEKSVQRNKGLYPSRSALNAAVPHPEVGAWALVGTEFPATLYESRDGRWISVTIEENIDVNLSDFLQAEVISSGESLFKKTITEIYSSDGGNTWLTISNQKLNIVPGEDVSYIIRPSMITVSGEELLERSTSDAYLMDFISPASFVSATITSSDNVTKTFTSGSLSWTIDKSYYIRDIDGSIEQRVPVSGDSFWLELVFNSKEGFREVIRLLFKFI